MHKFQSNGGIRCMAIRHFGELVRDMSQYRWMLNNAVFRALVPLILFLEDRETRVTTVSPAILLFLVWQRHAVFYRTPDKETLIVCFLFHRHVNIHLQSAPQSYTGQHHICSWAGITVLSWLCSASATIL